MVVSFSLLKSYPWCCSIQFGREHKDRSKADKLQLRKPLTADSLGTLLSRRAAILCSGASLVSFFTLSCGLTPSLVKAEENSPNAQEEEGDNGVIGAIKSLFDPNEKTKSGKLLPKAYLKAAREVVKALRESLEEDTKDVAKFRRSADAAKDSIREYLNGWRGRQAVSTEVPKPRIAWRILLETKRTTRTRLTAYVRHSNISVLLLGRDVTLQESYAALERAIRSLVSFYSKAGPFATLSEEVKKSILDDLNTADANL